MTQLHSTPTGGTEALSSPVLGAPGVLALWLGLGLGLGYLRVAQKGQKGEAR